MVKQSAQHRIEHMLHAIERIEEFMDQVDIKKFKADVKLQSAVQFQFLIIGEAVRHLDSELLERYNYPWHIPRAFRNFIIHEYHDIKLDRIYHAARDLGKLEKMLRKMLEK